MRDHTVLTIATTTVMTVDQVMIAKKVMVAMRKMMPKEMRSQHLASVPVMQKIRRVRRSDMAQTTKARIMCRLSRKTSMPLTVQTLFPELREEQLWLLA